MHGVKADLDAFLAYHVQSGNQVCSAGDHNEQVCGLLGGKPGHVQGHFNADLGAFAAWADIGVSQVIDDDLFLEQRGDLGAHYVPVSSVPFHNPEAEAEAGCGSELVEKLVAVFGALKLGEADFLAVQWGNAGGLKRKAVVVVNADQVVVRSEVFVAVFPDFLGLEQKPVLFQHATTHEHAVNECDHFTHSWLDFLVHQLLA